MTQNIPKFKQINILEHIILFVCIVYPKAILGDPFNNPMLYTYYW